MLLVASVFGEQRRLEPMPADRRARWRREIDWLLSVTDYVVEFAPSQQKNKDGTTMEVSYLLPCSNDLVNNPYDLLVLLKTDNDHTPT